MPDKSPEPTVVTLEFDSASELVRLADDPLQRTLRLQDRDALRDAARSILAGNVAGTLIGSGLGVWSAFRLRRARRAFARVFRVHDRPSHLFFRSGHIEDIPDVTPLLKSHILGDIAACIFGTAGGFFIGSQIGFYLGTSNAGSILTRDIEGGKRIAKASMKSRAAELREEADMLDPRDGGN
ncbi:hypothetical protein BO71DRAFT_339714 [Aspergillus ellipticus CBS 707.79]|uniref:Uncharacterized protein n=1 Tax=Aspergillus ellipticus CBS 707.79 TaxID=1448320 RepID=A0A319DIX1_9EURO|nr:hypothetical protein BO71DRAFT_339714 [Aspergillus ellipticus CBS 707.79]